MSIRSSLIDIIMRQFNRKNELEDETKFKEYLNKKRESNLKPYKLKYPFNKSIVVESQKIRGMQYYVFNRENCEKTFFYFHGGSYIDKPLLFHFRFIEKLLLKKKVCIVFPIYPRLPENTAEMCYRKLNKLFTDFVSKNEVGEVIFMGDSAGGGLALSMAQQAKLTHDYCKNSNQKVVLLSPWLDVSTDNKKIKEISKKDYQLSQILLQKLGKLWSDDTKSSIASPLFGDVDCGEICLMIGTRDILYPDCVLLKEKVEKLNKSIKFVEFNNMPHCFMLMPTKEAEDAFKILLSWV